MSSDLTASVVYLDEGDEEGGIAHPTQDLIDALEERISVQEVPIEHGRSSNPHYWYRLGQRASEEADVVHIQFEYGSFGDLGGMFLGSLFPVFAQAVDVPMVATLHNFRDRRVDVSVSNPTSIATFIAEHATWFVDRSLVRHTDFFIPLMKAEESLLQRHGVPADRIEHIPLVPETDPEIRDEETCKRNLGLEGKRVVTAFGWVRRSKGYDRVISILDDLPEETVFLIAGGTRTEEHEAYRDELEELAAERGVEDQVVFTGYVDRAEHPTIMSATDVMVFPYRDNRASDALARALSYELPVVTSNNAEFSAFENEWGCVRTAGNDEELRAAIEAALTDDTERERLIKNARTFKEKMNWSRVADRILNIFQEITDH